jgi:polar amino acid transport system substrate-binding protein
MTIVYRVNAGQLPADHWSHDATEGGGRIIGEACHFIDFVQYLTDALPARVCAEGVTSKRTADYVDDSVAISMSMTDGSIASIIYTASGDKSVAKEQVEIFCDRSVASIDDFKSGAFTHNGKTVKLGGRNQDKGHAAEMSAFFEAARGRTQVPISFESLVATSVASFAVIESAKDGAAVVLDMNSVLGA